MVAAKAWTASRRRAIQASDCVGAFTALLSSAPSHVQPGLRDPTADTLARVSPARFLAAPASIREVLLRRICCWALSENFYLDAGQPHLRVA